MQYDVQKYEEKLTGAWRQMSTLRRRYEKWCKGDDIEDCTRKQRYEAPYQSMIKVLQQNTWIDDRKFLKKRCRDTGILFLARRSKYTFLFFHFPWQSYYPGWISCLFFSVRVFTTGLVTIICPSSPLFGLFVFFSSPWSRDISFFVRVYYSYLFSQTVCTVLLSQDSLHEPVLWTSSLPSPGFFSIPSDWRRVPNI